MGWVLATSPDLLALLASIPLLVVLGIFVWRYRAMPAAIPMLALLLVRGVWVLSRIFILLSADPEEKQLWYGLTAACKLLTVTVGLSIIFEFVSPGTWLKRRNVTLLLLPGLVAALLFMSRQLQGLFWSDLRIDEVIQLERTPWNWAFVGYFYGYSLVAMVALLRFAQRAPIFRWSAAIMIMGMSTSLIVDILLGAGLLSKRPIDPSILAFIFVQIMYTVAIFGLRAFFDLIPLARETAIEQMHDGVAVLNAQGMVVFQNPTAQELLTMRWWQAKHDNGDVDASTESELVEFLRQGITRLAEIVAGTGSAQKHYIVRVTALDDPRGWRLGNLLVFHDITDRIRAQELLIQQQRTLAIREERERIASELHDDLGQVLGYVKLQAQATRDLLAKNRGEGADQALARLIAVSQEAHTDVREFILGARASSSLDRGFLPTLEAYLKRFNENFGLPTQLHLPSGQKEIDFKPAIAVQLLRIIQEALTNARKHACASCVTITFTELDDRTQIVIQDNGRGIQPGQHRDEDGLSFGIGLIRRRAEGVGGTLEVHSTPNQGTQVVVSIPRVEEDA